MAPKYRPVFFLLFTLSGFSGLIYESIWTHYLKLFLGHAAYAQTLVLAIFMGGMAIGSWLCSRYSARWGNLLAGYAVAEGVIGICAMVFHTAFTRTIDLAYTSFIPALANPAAVNTCKWTISALMILPQSILLGMTFPLMSAGILRLFPDRPGRTIALLYFTNSIGAAIGVLVSGFVLIRMVGLPGTMVIAGLINLVLASTVWFLIKGEQAGRSDTAEAQRPLDEAVQENDLYRLFLVASLVTGTASFIYEISWIRMLTLVLGSSTHAFELMLSAFILGLALGGLWIQRRIDRVGVPVRFLAMVQVVMGVLALSTLLLYGNTFSVMQRLVLNLGKTDAGYALFNLSSIAIAIAIMLPTTFCAGMTLPLITFVLLREGDGERCIGAVYAANTVGAIIGVFFAIHFGMPLLGLKGTIASGASLDIALGLVLLWRVAARHRNWRLPVVVTVVGVAAVAATLLLVDLDLYKMGSGVYRQGVLLPRDGFRHLYHLDGKTATVDVFRGAFGSTRINTNGKTDATIVMEPGRAAAIDEPTMVLLAAIPMALHPQATTAAAIGLGSGLTSQTLLTNPLLRRVDTIEIEQGIVAAANNFRPNVELVYTDPRSRIHVDDAKTFFSTHAGTYDIIVSEPSNPWVSGVSGLFSEEFYRLIQRNMSDDGLFVQWVQLYEIDVELVVSVLKAVSASFSDYAVYASNGGDIMIIARKSGRVPEVDGSVFTSPLLSASLKRVQIEGVQDLAVRKIGNKKVLDRFLASYPVRANSDYYPVLDQNAARTRFLQVTAQELLYFTQIPVPTLELLSGAVFPRERTTVTLTGAFPKTRGCVTAMALRDYFLTGRFDSRGAETMSEEDKRQAVQLKSMFSSCTAVPDQKARLDSMFMTAENIIPYLAPAELEAVWRSLEAGPCAASFSPLEKQCIALFKAVGRRDGAGMAATAGALLKGSDKFRPLVSHYVVATGMLGNLLQGNREEAYLIWSRYKGKLFGNREPELLFRLLAAESSAR
jgi:spermidine synthase